MKQPSHQNHSQPRKSLFLPQMILKTTICKLQILYSLILFYMSLVCHLYVIHKYSYVTCVSLVYHRMSLVCHPYVIRMSLVCHPYVIRMSLVCHSYLLVYHPCVTLMYLYVTCMSHVCTCMSFVCHWFVVLSWTMLLCDNHWEFWTFSIP